MSELTEQQREQIADACDAAFDFGDTWIRFLRNGNETMLLPVVARMLAASWEAGYRTNRGTVDQGVLDLHNPYKREVS